jgi:hypothetical protein
MESRAGVTTFKVGDEVVYVNPLRPDWVGTEGIVKGITIDGCIRVLITKCTKGSAWAGESKTTRSFTTKKWEHIYMKYDPNQQEDTENDI